MRHAGGIPTGAEGVKSRRGIKRRLAALFAADISGYSTLMADNEEDTHRRVGSAMAALVREIERSYGRVFSFAGDGLMAEFPSAVEALKCALRVQAAAARRNVRQPDRRPIEYRIGVNSGEIVVQKDRAGGNAVNIAARLEQMAEPGGIYLSNAVFEQVNAIIATGYVRLGERRLKNIREPVVIYRIPSETCRSWAGMPALPRLTVPNAKTKGDDYRPSLAVLPLRTSPSQMVDDYFAEGMVDDIIRQLGGLKELLVISRSSALAASHAPLDLRRIGHELDVRYVLHGSVRRSGDRLRIAMELSEAESGEMMWADRFEGDLSDLFNLQDRIAMRVATAIAPPVRERELGRAMRKHPASMTAYDLTLQALEQIYQLNPGSFQQAGALLREAIGHDPRYGLAHAYLAYMLILIIGQGWSRDIAADSARMVAAAETAFQCDPNDPMALALYGHTHSYGRRDFDTAMTFLDRALLVGPSCAFAWSLNSFTCQYRGDLDNAVTRAEHGVRLCPIGPDAFWHESALAQAHYAAGNHAQAISWGLMSAAKSPNNGSNLRVLVASFVASGEMERARHFAQRVLGVSPDFQLQMFRHRTPLGGALRETFVDRLRTAGLPD
jgi:adenylate cyclase